MTGMLSTGSSALLAFQRALGTVSHNVANATTAGYSRQRVDMAARPGQPQAGGGYIGQGVDVAALQRLADGLVFARQVDSTGEVGRLAALSSMADRVDLQFSDSATGLSAPFASFFTAARGVASDPTSTSARNALLAAAQSLTNRWQSLDGQMRAIETETNQGLEARVADANRLAAEIADLNRSIGAAGGNVAPDMLDARDLRIAELAGITGATLVRNGNMTDVFLPGGQPLVLGAQAMALSTVQDPSRPERLGLQVASGGGSTLKLADSGVGGAIGGLFEFRGRVLDPARNELGRLATVFAMAMNTAQASGVDANGNPGQPMFSVPAPRIDGFAGNTGGASFTGSVSNPAALSGQDVVLRYDGSSWTATRAGSGVPVAMTGTGTAGDPFVVEGVSLVMSGAANAGDRFDLRPTTEAAGGIRLAFNDPALVAAASPIAATALPTNLGNATVASSRVTGTLSGFTGAQVEFIDANNYTVDGAGPFAWTPGTPITAPDGSWEITLSGTPAAGDAFALSPTPPGSSDNRNALLFSALDSAALMPGGMSLKTALGEMVAKAGTEARHAGLGLEAQLAIDAQVTAERESVSGVNLDQEAADLMKFQQAYQAAAQVLKTADTMFQTLISSVGR